MNEIMDAYINMWINIPNDRHSAVRSNTPDSPSPVRRLGHAENMMSRMWPVSNLMSPCQEISRTFRDSEGYRAGSLIATDTTRVLTHDKTTNIQVIYLVSAFKAGDVLEEESTQGNESERDREAAGQAAVSKVVGVDLLRGKTRAKMATTHSRPPLHPHTNWRSVNTHPAPGPQGDRSRWKISGGIWCRLSMPTCS